MLYMGRDACQLKIASLLIQDSSAVRQLFVCARAVKAVGWQRNLGLHLYLLFNSSGARPRCLLNIIIWMKAMDKTSGLRISVIAVKLRNIC